MPASFSNAYGSVTFSRAPLYPQGSTSQLQARAESTGGEPITRATLGSVTPLTLTWEGMSKANLLELQTFFLVASKGMARQFTYTDIAGVVKTVRFATPEFKSIERAFERFDLTVSLLQE